MHKLQTKYVTVYALIFILSYMLFFQNYWKHWHNDNETPFQYDVDQYYSYLPATFIYHDLDFNYNHYYWLTPTKTGHRVPKMTCGMAILYSPFFALGCKVAKNEHQPVDGYSTPFKTCVHYGSLFYCLLGLIFLALVLRRFFTDITTAFTLITIFFATNLFCYSMREGEMSHGYLFFLISLFLWLTCKWHETKKSIYFLWLGMTVGLASLIRPTEILIALIFIGYDVRSFNDLKIKLKEVVFSFKNIPLLLIGFIIMWAPQLILWKVKSGQFLFFSYADESFFWSDPQILNLLFSYRKGWFVYTPIMIFSMIGLPMLKSYTKKFTLPIIIYMCINIYVLSCWWCWWYGGSFGMRSLVQTYALMAIPMAAFYETIFSYVLKIKIITIIIRSITVAAFSFFIFLNLLQTYCYDRLMLHYDSMSKETYWNSFMKFSFTKEDWEQQQEDIIHPNYDEAMKGRMRN